MLMIGFSSSPQKHRQLLCPIRTCLTSSGVSREDPPSLRPASKEDGEGGEAEAGPVRAQAEPSDEEGDAGDEEDGEEDGAEGVGEDGHAAVSGPVSDPPGACRCRALLLLLRRRHFPLSLKLMKWN